MRICLRSSAKNAKICGVIEKLNLSFDKNLAIDMVLNSLPPSYDQFILTYHLNNTETTLTQLHNLLQTAESGMKKNHVPSVTSAPDLAISQNKVKKRNVTFQSNQKGKAHAGASGSGSKAKPNFDVPAVSDPKEDTCFHYGKKKALEKKLPKVHSRVEREEDQAIWILIKYIHYSYQQHTTFSFLVL